MGALGCPRCGSDFVRRSGRKSAVERLLSFAYVFPFRCQLCQHRFQAFRWRERYLRTAAADRREYERLPIQAWSTLWWRDGHQDARVTDLSIAGCSIETDSPVAEGEVIQLKLAPGPDERAIVVDRAVVRSTQPGRLGVQFIRVQQDEEGRLRQYLYEVFVSRLH